MTTTTTTKKKIVHGLGRFIYQRMKRRDVGSRGRRYNDDSPRCCGRPVKADVGLACRRAAVAKASRDRDHKHHGVAPQNLWTVSALRPTSESSFRRRTRRSRTCDAWWPPVVSAVADDKPHRRRWPAGGDTSESSSRLGIDMAGRWWTAASFAERPWGGDAVASRCAFGTQILHSVRGHSAAGRRAWWFHDGADDGGGASRWSPSRTRVQWRLQEPWCSSGRNKNPPGCPGIRTWKQTREVGHEPPAPAHHYCHTGSVTCASLPPAKTQGGAPECTPLAPSSPCRIPDAMAEGSAPPGESQDMTEPKTGPLVGLPDMKRANMAPLGQSPDTLGAKMAPLCESPDMTEAMTAARGGLPDMTAPPDGSPDMTAPPDPIPSTTVERTAGSQRLRQSAAWWRQWARDWGSHVGHRAKAACGFSSV